jgi:AcrR family transcriptional regulator
MPKPETRSRLLSAARELIVAGDRMPSAGAVAARAGVSRLTIYDHFGSYPGLLAALAEKSAVSAPPPAADLRAAIQDACERWATDPGLFRRLPPAESTAVAHDLATALAAADRLRPGCSVREAEDVIGLVISFPVFDRLHRDGRRSSLAVAEILNRLASSILAA